MTIMAGPHAGLHTLSGHPALCDGFAGHAPGYRYRAELDALRAAPTIAALRHSGFRLGSYGDASARHRPASRHWQARTG
jgi:hypothetical protein